MNVRCPYCGCCYEIDVEMLGNPIGNPKLGYGWWLRCYKCHKKWWLKNTFVEKSVNTPIKADKNAKIERISSLVRRRRCQNKSRVKKVIVLGLLLVAIGFAYQERAVFYDYLLIKAKKLSENVNSKVMIADVKYDIDENNLIKVFGNLVNYDERMIAKINGVKVSIYDDKSMILSWNEEFEDMKILPHQKIPFSTSKQLPGDVKDMRVEVSIF